MAIQVHFNGVDRSSFVRWQTLLWEQNLTNETDVLSFETGKYGARNFTPVILDTVELYDDGVLSFGGTVLDVQQSIIGASELVYKVRVGDFVFDFNRFLIQEQYKQKPVINIINDILNKYVNRLMRAEIADFEPSEIWEGDGTPDTTNFRDGEQGLKLTATASTTKTASRLIFLDLTVNGLGNSDYIEIECYVVGVANYASGMMKLGNAALSSYYSKSITGLVEGWNLFKVLKSSFSTTGSPAWAAINKIQLEVTAGAGGTVEVTFDNWQAIKASAYTRNNALTATQLIDNIILNLEYPSKALARMAKLFSWDWYVDESKDIHFFPKFNEAAPFNLSDNGGKYIFHSLIHQQNADQLRNSIYVRGGDYLLASRAETFADQVDGVNKILLLGYRYDLETIVLTQNSVEKAVGRDGIDGYGENRGASQTLFGVANKNIGDVSGNYYQSMQVISEMKARRTKFKIRLRKVGTPVDNFTFRVYADNGSNQPNLAAPLSSLVSLAGSSIATSYAETTFTLAEQSTNSLLIDLEEKYHVVASRSGSLDASNYYQIDVYADVYDGKEYSGTSAPVWTALGFSWYFIEVLGYDILYNEDEKTLSFNTAPAAIDVLTFEGQPKQPVFVQFVDNVSKSSYGEFQFKVLDKTVESQEAAQQRALQETLPWGNAAVDVSYRTYEPGLRVGQTQNIQSTIRGLDLDVIIKKVTARARSFEAFEYQVDCVSAKSMNFIYWLQSLIQDQSRELQVDANELLTRIEGLSEEFTVTDEVATTLYTGHVWSDDAGTTPDRLIWDGGASHIWV